MLGTQLIIKFIHLRVQLLTCHERGACGPDNIADPNGGDSGPADGSVRACSASFAVPLHLTDGLWTLQWVLIIS